MALPFHVQAQSMQLVGKPRHYGNAKSENQHNHPKPRNHIPQRPPVTEARQKRQNYKKDAPSNQDTATPAAAASDRHGSLSAGSSASAGLRSNTSIGTIVAFA